MADCPTASLSLSLSWLAVVFGSLFDNKPPVKKLILILSMLLAGCAAEVLSTTDQLIVVKARERNRPEAQDLAEAKCQQRGLHARLTRRVAEDQLGFECVR